MARHKPLIGIPADRRILGPHPFHCVGEKYIAAVADAAEAIPLLVPALGERDLDQLLETLDGILLTGSPSNVEPHRYAGPASDPDTVHDPHRDSTTLPLIPHAIERGVPGRARSPDGSRLAFMTFRNQTWGIYLSQDVSRRDARLLVAIGYTAEAPVWSPDGSHLAFIAQVSGTTDLYVIGVDDGSQPHRLTSSRQYEASPVWRPS